MNETYFMDAGSNFIAHFGIKGMKWGSRKRSNPKRDARLQKRVNKKIHKGRHIVYTRHDNGLETLGYDYNMQTRNDRRMANKTSRKAMAYKKELAKLKRNQRKSFEELSRGL